MNGFIAYWIVMALTFVILTFLPLGIESDSLGKTVLASVVFGLLNGLVAWFIDNWVVNLFTVGLPFLIGNTILFGLSALLIRGFRLKWGLVSAFLGGISTAIISSLLSTILF